MGLVEFILVAVIVVALWYWNYYNPNPKGKVRRKRNGSVTDFLDKRKLMRKEISKGEEQLKSRSDFNYSDSTEIAEAISALEEIDPDFWVNEWNRR